MKHDISFPSQYDDLPPEWRHRGCGIVALKIVLDHFHAQDEEHQTVSISDLLVGGLARGTYRDGIGWAHAGLAELARSLGYEAFNRDLAPQSRESKSPEDALGILQDDLAHGPVLVSVWKRYDPTQGGGHIVVVYGSDESTVSIIDPEMYVEESAGKIVAKTLPKDDFLRGFKQRSICVRPTEAVS